MALRWAVKTGVIVAAGLLVGAAVWHGHGSKAVQTAVRPRLASTATTRTTASPSPVSYAYTLAIPRLGISTGVESVGLTAGGEVGVPSTVKLAAWFKQSSRPGEPGLAVIDGHLDGPAGPGVFAQLSSLRTGDGFTVTRADGRLLRYRVTGSQTVPVEQTPGVLFSQDPAFTSQLNLVTCGGTFNESTGRYRSRTIVSGRLE